MAIVTQFLGLDYHESTIRVCVMNQAGDTLANFQCPNDVEVLLARVPAVGRSVHAAVESCTGAANFAEELIQRAGWTVALAHPGYVSRMKQTPDKSDCTDAQLLADLVRVGYLPRVWLAPHEVRELRRMVRYRQQLANERRDAKLRIGAMLRDQRVRCTHSRRWTKAWLQWLRTTEELSEHGRWIIDRHLDCLDRLRKDIHAVEQRLAAMTREDTVVTELMKLVGIGPVAAWFMRAEIGRFDRFDSGKQLARFCGLSPRNASSGQRQADAGLIKAANPQLRAVLIQAAHSLCRHDPHWRQFAQRLRQNGKPYNVAVAAVANRWIRKLFHQMQSAA